MRGGLSKTEQYTGHVLEIIIISAATYAMVRLNWVYAVVAWSLFGFAFLVVKPRLCRYCINKCPYNPNVEFRNDNVTVDLVMCMRRKRDLYQGLTYQESVFVYISLIAAGAIALWSLFKVSLWLAVVALGALAGYWWGLWRPKVCRYCENTCIFHPKKDSRFRSYKQLCRRDG